MSNGLPRLWGENMRLLRQAHDAREGIPAEAGLGRMAEAIEVSKATVSRWETGRSAPTDMHKVDIAEYLQVDVRVLFPLVRTPT